MLTSLLGPARALYARSSSTPNYRRKITRMGGSEGAVLGGANPLVFTHISLEGLSWIN